MKCMVLNLGEFAKSRSKTSQGLFDVANTASRASSIQSLNRFICGNMLHVIHESAQSLSAYRDSLVIGITRVQVSGKLNYRVRAVFHGIV